MTVMLARFEFAFTASVHFLFVLLTLGLVTFVAVLQTWYARTGDAEIGRMTRFWGLLYVVNYAVGIVTGLVMEFQLGLNWSGLGLTVGDVFGGPLALETLFAFVVESTLLGMWIFGWGRLGRRLHAALIWGVAASAYLSAFWVMVANAFLANPVGYTLGADGRARLASFGALFGNPSLWLALGHAISAALLTGGLFVAGVSAWHLRARAEDTAFYRSLRLGGILAFGGLFLTVVFGGPQFGIVRSTQPTKSATGEAAAALQAQLAAQHGPGDYLPPGWIRTASGTMIGIWFLLLVVTAAGIGLLLYHVKLDKPVARGVLRVLVWAIPLPFLAAVCGWVFREVGRFPWAVYGVLRIDDALSPLSTPELAASLVGFSLLIGALAVVDWVLLARLARRGPGNEFLPPGDADRDAALDSSADAGHAGDDVPTTMFAGAEAS
jgi:cytochrome d ubiquinol oxidase subunit I